MGHMEEANRAVHSSILEERSAGEDFSDLLPGGDALSTDQYLQPPCALPWEVFVLKLSTLAADTEQPQKTAAVTGHLSVLGNPGLHITLLQLKCPGCTAQTVPSSAGDPSHATCQAYHRHG